MVYRIQGFRVRALLLEKSADVHAVDNQHKQTALYYAAENKAGPKVFGLLLSMGAEKKKSNGNPILIPEQEASALAAATAYAKSSSFMTNLMRSNEKFLEAFIDPQNLDSIDAYIDAPRLRSTGMSHVKSGRCFRHAGLSRKINSKGGHFNNLN